MTGYVRQGRNANGLFHGPQDVEREARIQYALEAYWGCQLHTFGPAYVLDWSATRNGKVVAVIEAKARSHHSDRYGTVYLNPRKLAALIEHGRLMNALPLYVVEFLDGIRWIDVRNVDPQRQTFGGRSYQIWTRNDRELLIEVPVNEMKRLHEQPWKEA